MEEEGEEEKEEEKRRKKRKKKRNKRKEKRHNFANAVRGSMFTAIYNFNSHAMNEDKLLPSAYFLPDSVDYLSVALM